MVIFRDGSVNYGFNLVGFNCIFNIEDCWEYDLNINWNVDFCILSVCIDGKEVILL